jgi:hypothetical protein
MTERRHRELAATDEERLVRFAGQLDDLAPFLVGAGRDLTP